MQDDEFIEYPATFLISKLLDSDDASHMLGVLLAHDVIFLNDHWFMGSRSPNSKLPESCFRNVWPDDAAKTVSLNVICSDTFYYASADAEEITLRELPELFKYWQQDPEWGPIVWCIKKRGMRPLPQISTKINAGGIWNLNELDLKSNPYD